MSYGEEKPVILTRFICKLRCGSQALLARASDNNLYITKFRNNPQGGNLLFNECMGTELFRRGGLPVPCWRPLVVTRQFVADNPGCWVETPDGLCPPEIGACFGSLFLGTGGMELFEILPGNSFKWVANRSDFWLAWLLDVCARHADNRQALFHKESKDKLAAVFIDHGHMFCGPIGNVKSHFIASQYYQDPRIYPNVSSELVRWLQLTVAHIDVDWLWTRVLSLPEDWITHSGLCNLAECLDTLSKPDQIEKIIALMRNWQDQRDASKASELTPPQREPAHAGLGSGKRSGGPAWPACAMTGASRQW